MEKLDSFTLDLYRLKVEQVRVDRRQVTFAIKGNKLEVQLKRPIRKGERFRVEVVYGGTATPLPDPTLPGDDTPLLGWLSNAAGSFVVSEPVGASSFFPCNDELTDRATFSIRVTAPKSLSVAANGKLKTVTELGAKRRYQFEMDEPMTTWLATIQVNQYKVTKLNSVFGTPVKVYSTPSTSPEAIEGFLAARDMLPRFETWFGRYPYDLYGSVTIDDPRVTYALETQALSTFPSDWYTEDVVAHELAHQWFGNSVAIKTWADLWLAEGFATYVETFWPNRDDPATFNLTKQAIYDYVKARNVGPAVVDAPEDMFTDRTYYRGVLVLYALESKIGRPALFKLLRSWTSTYGGKLVDTDDFLDHVVKVTGKPALKTFLRPWIFDETVPDYRFVPDKKGAAADLASLLPAMVPHRRR